MASDDRRADASTVSVRWCTSDGSDHVVGVAQPVLDDGGGSERGEHIVSVGNYVADANDFAGSVCRDFRALHQLNHDHDCKDTCVKYVHNKKKAAADEALKRGMVVGCRFLFYHIVEFACGAVQKTIKRIRRRGKKLVEAPYVACSNDRNEFGKVVLVRHTPFRPSTTDVGQSCFRCNIDFQFIPRTLDLDELIASTVSDCGDVQPAIPPHVVPQTEPKLVLAMYGVRLQLPDAPLLRR